MSPLTPRPHLIQKISSLLADLPAKKAQEVGLSRSSAALLKTIVCFANKQDIHAKIHINQRTLCERTGYGRTTVSQAFNQLVELGLIHREQQRKIGRDRWSSPAFCLTEKFVQWLGAMCSVFEHSLNLASQDNKKKISDMSVATQQDSTEQAQAKTPPVVSINTRHGLFIKNIDAAEAPQVEAALNSISKKQALTLLWMASKAGVRLQDAIVYTNTLRTKVKNWYAYLKTAIVRNPQDYRAILNDKRRKQAVNDDLLFVLDYLRTRKNQKINLAGKTYTVEAGGFYCVADNSSITVNAKNATAFANRIKRGLLSPSITPAPAQTTPPPPPAVAVGAGKGRAAAAEAMQKARSILWRNRDVCKTHSTEVRSESTTAANWLKST